jgi:hypothetical protein
MCVLRVNGTDFAVDEFIKETSLKPSIIYRKGEKNFGEKVQQSSGFNVSLSNAEFDDLRSQINDAISFLRKENDELKRLLAFPNIESASVDFAISTPTEDIIIWTRSFPAELLNLLGSLGMELDFTVYPKSY